METRVVQADVAHDLGVERWLWEFGGVHLVRPNVGLTGARDTGGETR